MDAFPFLGIDCHDARALPWAEARVASMPGFLERYTLHDSRWLRLDALPDGAAVLALAWDTHWTDGRVRYPLSDTAAMPLLLIGFDCVLELRFGGDARGSGEVVGRAESSRMAPDEARTWAREKGAAEMEGVYRTTFYDVAGGRVDLVHAETVRLLCLDESRCPIPIPWDPNTS